MTSSVDTARVEDANPAKKVETFEDILIHVGEAGRYQWLLFLVLLPFAFVYAFLYFTQFFLTLTPNQHWCTVPELNGSNLTDQQKIHFSIPIADANELLNDKSAPYSKCQMYDVNYTELVNSGVKNPNSSWPITSCRHGWTFNYSTVPYVSIAAELEWVCEKAYYSSIAQSVFFIGSIIGGFIFGYIADHYGRLPALIACNAVGFFGSIATAFCNNFWTFCLCRLIVGTAFDNCFNILFIIVIEYVGPKHRTFMVNMSFGVYFAGSSSILPWIAYYIANWRILSGVSAAPLVIAFASPWLVPESARWHISNGNISKAIEMLKKFEKVNGKTVKKEIYAEFEQSCNEMMKNDQSFNKYTVLDLFKKPRLAYITIMMIIYWLLIILVFDGHVWNMKLLDPDVFTSFSLAALTVLPASILLTLFLDKWGRRWMSFFSMMICGIFSFITLAMPPGGATVGMGIIARFGVTIAASIGFQYAAEILPTVVRAQGVSLIHIVGYLAHIIGPYVIYLSAVSSVLPLIVLGLLALAVAMQALFMPETLGQNLPQTLQEGNDFGRDQNFWWVPCISSTYEKKKEFRKSLTPGSLQRINSMSLKKALEMQKMSRTREIKALFLDPTIEASESTLSFVKCLIPSLKSTKTLLLHREKKTSPKRYQLEATPLDDPESTLLDTTGSPLEYELDYSKVDETIIDIRNWKREEEFYLPLAKLEACMALNCCLEKLSEKDLSLPVLVMCDGKNHDKTVLLGSYVESGWFTTIQGHCMDPQQSSNIEETPALLLKEYTEMLSLQKQKVVIAVCSTYELCGKRPGVTDLSDLFPGCFNGNLNIEINWNTLSFSAPIRASTSTLIMEIIAGSDGSCLKKLWKELTLLNKYIDMLEQCKPNEQNSHKFVSSNSVTWDEIEKKLNLLLHNKNEHEPYKDDIDEDCGDVADDCKLKEHIDNVHLRQNMDFVDMLWELLIGVVDNAQLTSCFHIILERVQLGLTTPQISRRNSSRVAKIISEILCKKTVVPMLGKNLPLELLIDTGLEKLNRDYTYILLRSNLIDIHDIPQILCNVQGEFSTESYRKKLSSLAQIHLCLEFTAFAQNYLRCSTANLQSIFMHAYREYASKNSAIKLFSDLYDNQILCLSVPLPTVAVEHIAKGLPSSWRLTLSSESNISTMTTTSYLSRNPILPPNIYSFDESNEHKLYHFLKVNTSSIKIS